MSNKDTPVTKETPRIWSLFPRNKEKGQPHSLLCNTSPLLTSPTAPNSLQTAGSVSTKEACPKKCGLMLQMNLQT